MELEDTMLNYRQKDEVYVILCYTWMLQSLSEYRIVITKTWRMWEEKERDCLIMRTQAEGIQSCFVQLSGGAMIHHNIFNI